MDNIQVITLSVLTLSVIYVLYLNYSKLNHIKSIEYRKTILEIIYNGDHTRIRVTLPNQKSDFTLKIPNSSNSAQIKENEDIFLGWASKDCRALDLA